MKFLLAAFFGVVAVCSCMPTNDEIKSFEDFKKVFGKTYANAEEEAHREQQFLKQLKWVEENQGKNGAEYGINQYSDMSDEEFSQHNLNGLNISQMMLEVPQAPMIDTYEQIPTNFDWRQKTHVNPVRNQGACGSCWAFAAASVAETLYAIHRHQNIILSEQELIDCTYQRYDPTYKCYGCQSGMCPEAFKYMKQKGLLEESHYPYKMKLNQCQANARGTRYHVSSYNSLRYRAGDQEIQAAIMNHGPVVIYIHGSEAHFRNLRKGILRGAGYNDAHIDHAVVLVGWGTQNGIDYWIIRNSWGTQWGDAGYGFVERHHNSLGINNNPIYASL